MCDRASATGLQDPGIYVSVPQKTLLLHMSGRPRIAGFSESCKEWSMISLVNLPACAGNDKFMVNCVLVTFGYM